MKYFHGAECCRFEPHFPSLLYARQHNRARRRAYCRHDCLRRRRRTGGHRRHRGGQRQSQVRSPSNMRSKKKRFWDLFDCLQFPLLPSFACIWDTPSQRPRTHVISILKVPKNLFYPGQLIYTHIDLAVWEKTPIPTLQRHSQRQQPDQHDGGDVRGGRAGGEAGSAVRRLRRHLRAGQRAPRRSRLPGSGTFSVSCLWEPVEKAPFTCTCRHGDSGSGA